MTPPGRGGVGVDAPVPPTGRLGAINRLICGFVGSLDFAPPSLRGETRWRFANAWEPGSVESVRLLERAENPKGWPLLSMGASPVIIGTAASGISWSCGWCGTRVAERVHERQLIEVMFGCSSCGRLSHTPRRKPGEPIPRNVLGMGVGRVNLLKPLDVNGSRAIAGEPAIRAYERETGLDQGPVAGGDLSPRDLEHLVRDIRDIVGPQAFDALRASDRRAVAAGANNSQRHRLMVIVSLVETAAALPPDAEIGVAATVELHATVALLRRWRNHPASLRFAKSLKSANEFPHTVITLGLASLLADGGNGVGMAMDEPGSRIPDIWLQPSVIENLALEVKSPVRLRGRTAPVPFAAARRLLERCVKKTMSGSKRQLLSDRPALLAVGGLHLAPADVRALRRAANRILLERASRGRNPKLVGIALINLGVHQGPRGFGLGVSHELVLHPGYDGGLSIDRTPQGARTMGERPRRHDIFDTRPDYSP